MCGLFGFYSLGRSRLPSHVLSRCTELLHHRGPDDGGCIGWAEDGQFWDLKKPACPELRFGLGHRRLAVFDLSEAGHQPMTGPDGNWIVYNGEIYNFLEIREELRRVGHTFVTQTDTEVILASYAQWGRECVTHFNGMWAFALYDKNRNGLFASRDRLGVKPFYYAWRESTFCFASEVQPIFEALGMPVRVDMTQLSRYLAYDQSDDGPVTLYEDIRELRGGHCLWMDFASGAVDLWPYWDLPTESDLDLSDEQALDRFSELLEDSVRLRLRADVPVGITLSGGVDSSAVTLAAHRCGHDRLAVFTSHFPGQAEIDETDYASQVAKACGAEHVLVSPDLSRMVQEEPLLTAHQGMPYWSLSMYVHWAIVKTIREKGIPVFLSGQGGDELFMGYERYYSSYIRSLMPNVFAGMISAWQCAMCSRLSLSRLLAMVAVFGIPRLRKAIRLHLAGRGIRPDLLAKAPSVPMDSSSRIRELQRHELTGRQLSQLLRYDDRTVSAHGMEERHPFLDYRLVEFAYRLPWRYKISDGWTKHLVRRYLARHGLGRIAWRKNKLGFNAPQVAWMKELLMCRGAILQKQPFAGAILRPGVSIEALHGKCQWDAYNVLHLAHLMKWQCPESVGDEH